MSQYISFINGVSFNNGAHLKATMEYYKKTGGRATVMINKDSMYARSENLSQRIDRNRVKVFRNSTSHDFIILDRPMMATIKLPKGYDTRKINKTTRFNIESTCGRDGSAWNVIRPNFYSHYRKVLIHPLTKEIQDANLIEFRTVKPIFRGKGGDRVKMIRAQIYDPNQVLIVNKGRNISFKRSKFRITRNLLIPYLTNPEKSKGYDRRDSGGGGGGRSPSPTSSRESSYTNSD